MSTPHFLRYACLVSTAFYVMASMGVTWSFYLCILDLTSRLQRQVSTGGEINIHEYIKWSVIQQRYVLDNENEKQNHYTQMIISMSNTASA